MIDQQLTQIVYNEVAARASVVAIVKQCDNETGARPWSHPESRSEVTRELLAQRLFDWFRRGSLKRQMSAVESPEATQAVDWHRIADRLLTRHVLDYRVRQASPPTNRIRLL